MLREKSIVISGVGPGLGRAIARIAVQNGAKVGLGARNQAFLDELVDELQSAGGEAVALSTDVADAAQCEALAQAVVDRFGRIDGLINSAYSHGSWETADLSNAEEWGRVYDVNCIGALRMSQAVIPHMKAQKDGSIVNISSMTIVKPFSGEVAYAASKGALSALTRHMANDLGQFGIRVNDCRMGWIGGKSVFDYIDQKVESGCKREDVIAEITDRIPLRIIPPEDDCARAALFFVSDYSKVVTGTSLDVNGGEYMAP